MTIQRKSAKIGNVIIKLFFIGFSLLFIIPILTILGVSLTEESEILKNGYHLIPQKISFTAYKYVFKNPESIIDGYKVTIFFSLVGTFLSVLVMALIAYPLSRKEYRFRKPITFYVFFTMLFSGGLIPTYILNTQYLGLGDSVWVYILPGLVSGWYVIVIRTFFQGLPNELVESAKIDGCNEWRIFFSIIIPLSKPVLASVSLLILLGRWNDWMTSMIYIQNPKLYSLQYLLQKLINETAYLKSIMQIAPNIGGSIAAELPSETTKFAMCIIAAGPMLVVFPFFQKYFSKGLTVGSVKG